VSDLELVIFDLDGTLVDTVPDIAAALAGTLAGAGVAAPPLDVVKTMVGDGARELIKRALARAGGAGDLDALFAAFLVQYRAHVSDRSIVYPGIPELLDRLEAAGVASAVVTNKPGDIARSLLRDLGIVDRFVAVIGDGDGFARKPDPAAALSLLAKRGAQPARTAVVGDGLPDVRLGRALGARAIAAAWGYVTSDRLAAEHPTAVAASPEDAARLLLAGPSR
jgi:2-phosphoglycolate phosphatase